MATYIHLYIHIAPQKVGRLIDLIPKAQSLIVEISHYLMTFTIDACGSNGTCYQG